MTEIEPALSELASGGLNWIAFVPAGDAATPEGCVPGDGRGLLLFLSLGAAFWERTEVTGSDPLDARATALTLAFMDRVLRGGDPDCELLYPGDRGLDLRAWLERGQVQHRSRLGTGIRPDCGPWFAVRSAVWARVSPDQQASLRRRYPALLGPSPCEACVETPCVRACPGAALSAKAPLGVADLDRCVAHRLREASSCADRCLARLSCPVGAEHRYSDAQLRYHYGRSLRAIRRWKGCDVA